MRTLWRFIFCLHCNVLIGSLRSEWPALRSTPSTRARRKRERKGNGNDHFCHFLSFAFEMANAPFRCAVSPRFFFLEGKFNFIFVHIILLSVLLGNGLMVQLTANELRCKRDVGSEMCWKPEANERKGKGAHFILLKLNFTISYSHFYVYDMIKFITLKFTRWPLDCLHCSWNGSVLQPNNKRLLSGKTFINIAFVVGWLFWQKRPFERTKRTGCLPSRLLRTPLFINIWLQPMIRLLWLCSDFPI